MSELISGREALERVADGVVQYRRKDDCVGEKWTTITDHFYDQYNLGVFLNKETTWEFRLKPQTVKLEIEVPAPFEPKDGEEFFVIDNGKSCGFLGGKYREDVNAYKTLIQFGAYRTEEDIKKVVGQLRKLGVLK